MKQGLSAAPPMQCTGARLIRTIVHLSDLHFGGEDRDLVTPLIRSIRDLAPDIVALSGDLTDHATAGEFIQVREFLRMLPGVHIVVPGNRDLAFYNPVRRVWQRLALYKREVTPDLEPFYADEEVSILGLNTARVPLFYGGHFNRVQLRKVEHHMAHARGLRILVTHHPFGRIHPALDRMLASVDIVLSGHLHISRSQAHTGAAEFRAGARTAILVQAGTALSTRRQNEPNSFNFIRADGRSVVIEVWQARAGKFVPQAPAWFELPAQNRPALPSRIE